MTGLSEQGIRLSSMSPSFLNSNSTSHTWPFSAVAELIDNASDPGVSASQFWIDVKKEGDYTVLTFTDNGSGMTPSKLHKMLSFGFTDKGSDKASRAIGVYGNGFKSGSMRLGRDALIFTKNGGCQTVGMLSQTYLENIKAKAVIVPIVPFNQITKSLILTQDSEASLAAILQHSIVTSRDLIDAHFDSILSKKGTKIIIWNLRRTKDDKLEIDFDTDEGDFRLPKIQIEELRKDLKSNGSMRVEQSIPETHYSLRAYLSILYLKPRTQIILRDKKILPKLVSKHLTHIERDVYKPHFSKEKVKVTFGMNPKNTEHYGIMMYHKNRLIKAYEKVGCQLKTYGQRAGVGVIGIVECNFLKPAHNKQDFEYTNEYRITHGALGLKLNDYWKEMTHKKAREREFMALDQEDDNESANREPMWLQCEDCLKWRSVPRGYYNVTPESWKCSKNPNLRYRSCSSPEEAEEEQLKPSYQKTHKKQESQKIKKLDNSTEMKDSQKEQAVHPIRSENESENRDEEMIYISDTQPDFEQTPESTAEQDLVMGNQDKRTEECVTEDRRPGEDQLEKEKDKDGVQYYNTLSIKRKSDKSLYHCVIKKKRHFLGKQRHPLKSPDKDKTSSEVKSSDPPEENVNTVGSTQSAERNPAGETGQQTEERFDRGVKIQRLAELEKEAQKLRNQLGVIVTRISRSTMTASEESTEEAKPVSPPKETREVSCQTDRVWKERTTNDRRGRDSIVDTRSAVESLWEIRHRIALVLTAFIPQLNLSGISVETPDIDHILQHIIEANSLGKATGKKL